MQDQVWADDYQPGKKGSITIRLNDIGSYKGNVEFDVYQVGKPAGENNLQWKLTEKFAGCKVNLNELNTAEAQKEAANILEKAVASQTVDFTGKKQTNREFFYFQILNRVFIF